MHFSPCLQKMSKESSCATSAAIFHRVDNSSAVMMLDSSLATTQGMLNAPGDVPLTPPAQLLQGEPVKETGRRTAILDTTSMTSFSLRSSADEPLTAATSVVPLLNSAPGPTPPLPLLSHRRASILSAVLPCSPPPMLQRSVAGGRREPSDDFILVEAADEEDGSLQGSTGAVAGGLTAEPPTRFSSLRQHREQAPSRARAAGVLSPPEALGSDRTLNFELPSFGAPRVDHALSPSRRTPVTRPDSLRRGEGPSDGAAEADAMTPVRRRSEKLACDMQCAPLSIAATATSGLPGSSISAVCSTVPAPPPLQQSSHTPLMPLFSASVAASQQSVFSAEEVVESKRSRRRSTTASAANLSTATAVAASPSLLAFSPTPSQRIHQLRSGSRSHTTPLSPLQLPTPVGPLNPLGDGVGRRGSDSILSPPQSANSCPVNLYNAGEGGRRCPLTNFGPSTPALAAPSFYASPLMVSDRRLSAIATEGLSSPEVNARDDSSHFSRLLPVLFGRPKLSTWTCNTPL